MKKTTHFYLEVFDKNQRHEPYPLAVSHFTPRTAHAIKSTNLLPADIRVVKNVACLSSLIGFTDLDIDDKSSTVQESLATHVLKAVARGVFIYLCYAGLISFEINLKTTDFKRNLSGITRIYEYTPPPRPPQLTL